MFQVVDSILKESKKDRLEYKLEALQCFGNILELYSVDRFSDVWEICSPVLSKVCHDIPFCLHGT